MTMNFRPAQRSFAKPLIGLYGESGSGKTYTALVLARGFVGPHGKIGMIETEGGRGEAYADPVEYPEIDGYEVLSLRGDFSPARYGEALQAAEAAKLDALIVDSASHEWESTGGVLDMAAQNIATGKKGVLVWQQPKIEHQRRFMLPLLATPIPLVIVCMRAKYPMVEVERNGKKEWARSETLEPKQSEDILYEIFTHGWLDQQHRFHLTQCRSRSMQAIFEKVAPLSNETGRALAAWAKGAAAPTTQPEPSPRPGASQPAAASDPWGKHGTAEKWGRSLTLAINNAPDQETFDLLKQRALPAMEAYKAWSVDKYEALIELMNEKQVELLNQ